MSTNDLPATPAPSPAHDVTTLAELRRRSDILDLEGQLDAQEIEIRDRARAFVDEIVRPNIADWYERAHFPIEIATELGRRGLIGVHLDGYGFPGRSAVEYGLVALELEAGDSGLRTFVSVQGSLAANSIHHWGSEEQRRRWLPGLASGELIGSFGLTEPTAGSDPGSLRTFARREGSDWVLNGTKRWIGLATKADVAVIWAQSEEGLRGFAVPTDTPGYRATAIEPKLSLRASIQAEIELDEVRLPADAVLPGARGLRGPFTSLNEARYGIIWGVLGAARDSFEAALGYALERSQFGRPLAAFQLTQQKLVNQVLELQKGALLALHIGRRKDAGTLDPAQISLGKLNNVREAIAIAREARTIIGGNGITLDHSPLRHASNLESVRTYEGTDEVHTLILGQHLTGHAAFR